MRLEGKLGNPLGFLAMVEDFALHFVDAFEGVALVFYTQDTSFGESDDIIVGVGNEVFVDANFTSFAAMPLNGEFGVVGVDLMWDKTESIES